MILPHLLYQLKNPPIWSLKKSKKDFAWSTFFVVVNNLVNRLSSSPRCSNNLTNSPRHLENTGYIYQLWSSVLISSDHTQHIPTMTISHHGGILSVMMMVGICQWQNPTIDDDDDDDD